MEKEIVLHHIKDMAINNPYKSCLMEKNRVITYGQHWMSICECSEELKKHGIGKGTRVAVIAEQSARFLMVVSAIHLVGAVVIPLEKNLPDKRIKEIMERLESIWLISSRRVNIPDCTIIYFDKIEKNLEGRNDIEEEWELPRPDDLADILFTTGTTGEPKGIEITHLANKAIAENVIDSVELQEDDVELIPTPINHSLGLRRYYGAMYRGSTIGIIDGVIYAEDFFEMLDKYEATAITLVPTMLSILLKLSEDRLKKYNGQLRFIQLGSAPIPQSDRDTLCRILPNVRLYNTYGATESGCTCILDFNKIRNRMFCIGRPTVNATVSFIDDDGNEIQSSENCIGSMVFEGPMNMRGYWKEPELTKTILREGKIYTNDIGYRGEDGYIYLLGRKDDVINSGGNKIAPIEVEEVMLRYGKIEECACVPIADKLAGQIPKLYVVMKEGESFNRHDILAYLSDRLEFFKVPKMVEELEKLPRAYNGKILRRELKER